MASEIKPIHMTTSNGGLLTASLIPAMEWRKIARETIVALRKAADEIERQIGGDDGK